MLFFHVFSAFVFDIFHQFSPLVSESFKRTNPANPSGLYKMEKLLSGSKVSANMLGSDMGKMRRSDPGLAFCRARNLVQQEKVDKKKCRWDFHFVENAGSDLTPVQDFVGPPPTFSLCIYKILPPRGTTLIGERLSIHHDIYIYMYYIYIYVYIDIDIDMYCLSRQIHPRRGGCLTGVTGSLSRRRLFEALGGRSLFLYGSPGIKW